MKMKYAKYMLMDLRFEPSRFFLKGKYNKIVSKNKGDTSLR